MSTPTCPSFPFLSERDRQELYDSCIDDATIEQFGTYTEVNGRAVAHLLNRSRPYPEDMNGGLVYPIYDADGNVLSNYVQIKLHTPRRNAESKPIKYEVPAGTPYRIGFSPDSDRTLNISVPLIIVEGHKKGMCLFGQGYAVAILLGVDCWAEPGEDDDRPLHSDFDSVPLEGRTVAILFDTDTQRNHNVERARCRLAQRLVERGANVKMMTLPPDKNAAGEFIKVGVDDFIYRHGAEEFNRLFRELIESPPLLTLDEYRAAMSEANLAASREPGIYCVRCPTGSGKSFSMLNTLRLNPHPALIVQPTHRQNEELRELCERNGMTGQIAAYPALSTTTCRNYAEVLRRTKIGINRRLFCTTCPHDAVCRIRQQTQRAVMAPISVGTHARLSLSHSMRDGKRQVHIHENIAALLAPMMELIGDFRTLQTAVEAVRNRHQSSNETVRYCNQLLAIIRDGLRYNGTTETTIYCRPRIRRVKTPDGIVEEIFRELSTRNVTESIGNTFLFCQRVLQGRVRRVVVHCDTVRNFLRRTISVHLKSSIPRRSRRASYLFYDATLNHATAETMLGSRIIDITPRGRIRPVHRIIQYPDADIKRGTPPRRLLQILKSLLFLCYSDARRIGIICHSNHREYVLAFKDSLPAEQRERIVIVEYFHGSVSCGSNLFQQANLDVLFILGTPRIPTSTTRDRVILCHEIPYLDSEWGNDFWGGFTESGRLRTVSARSYVNHDWHEAQNEIVGSELIQAIGRGRIFNEDGIPLVVLLSNFNTGLGREDGLYLADDDLPKITRMALRDILQIATALRCPPCDAVGSSPPATEQLRATFAGNILQRILLLASSGEMGRNREAEYPTFNRMTSTQLATHCDIPVRTMTNKLRILERLGLVHKVGERRGYTITAENWTKIRLICNVTSLPTERQGPQASMNALRGLPRRIFNPLGRPLTVADTAPTPEMALYPDDEV